MDYDILSKYDTTAVELSEDQCEDVHLLELVGEYHDIYEHLCNCIREGFMDLKRADYVSGLRNMRYGPDFWDHRECLASKTVAIEDDGFHLIDSTPKTKKHGKGKQQSKVNEKKEMAGEKKDNAGEEEKVGEKVDEKKCKNRTKSDGKAKLDGDKPATSNVDDDKPQVKDPLKMFSGGLIPLPLRKSKNEMDRVLNDVIKLSNIESELHLLKGN